MSSNIRKRLLSGSAAPAVHPSQDSSAARPAGGGYDGATKRRKVRECQDDKSKDGATVPCLSARLPSEIWRELVGLLSYSDVAAWACCTSYNDTEQLLLGYMRRRCCVSTFKRLLMEYGAITTGPSASTAMDYDQQWDADFFNIPEERKYFWQRAIEIIFMCQPKLLLHGKHYRRYPALVQQDYIHSCGVLFASKAKVAMHRHLQSKFRASCKAPIRVQSRFRLLNIAPNIA